MDMNPAGAGFSPQRADSIGKVEQNLLPIVGPEENDVSRFQSAMESAASGGTPRVRPGDETPVGERVLGGLTDISDTVRQSRAEAASVLEKGDVTQVELLRASFSMMESSTLVSAVSKTTEKITQGVKTLQQG